HFLNHASQRLGRGQFSLKAETRELLAAYSWPGNVRELQNIITRACVLNQGKPIVADEVRPWLQIEQHAVSPTVSQTAKTLGEAERQLIVETLERFDGHRVKTAEALGIGVRTLSGKLREYGYAPREKKFSKAG